MIRNFKRFLTTSRKRNPLVLLLGMLLAPMVLLAWHTTYTYCVQEVMELMTSLNETAKTETTNGNATGLQVHQKL